MITEIILVTFAILYYLFSMYLFATVIQDTNKRHTGFQILGVILMTLVIAPIATPIILGIELGEWIKNN